MIQLKQLKYQYLSHLNHDCSKNAFCREVKPIQYTLRMKVFKGLQNIQFLVDTCCIQSCISAIVFRMNVDPWLPQKKKLETNEISDNDRENTNGILSLHFRWI